MASDKLSSQHSTEPLPRRSFLAASAAAALGSPMAVSPALADSLAPDPATTLFALVREWREATRAYDAHRAATRAAHDRYVATRPPIPGVLLDRPTDRAMNLPVPHWDRVGRGWPEGTPKFYGEPVVNRIKATLREQAWKSVPGKRARAEEIVAAFEPLYAADKAASAASGYREDAPEEEALDARAVALEKAMARHPARTMAGLRLKAEAVVRICDTYCEGIDEASAEAEADGNTEILLALSLVRDLLALAPGGPVLSSPAADRHAEADQAEKRRALTEQWANYIGQSVCAKLQCTSMSRTYNLRDR